MAIIFTPAQRDMTVSIAFLRVHRLFFFFFLLDIFALFRPCVLYVGWFRVINRFMVNDFHRSMQEGAEVITKAIKDSPRYAESG